MLSTKELEYDIKKIITDKIPNLKFEDINFCEGNDNSPEGIYVFSKDNKYNLVFAEKGEIRYKKELSDVIEVLWNVLNLVLFDIAMEDAISNRQNGKDFRRELFKKEIELFSLFGNEFKKRKIEEIQDILLKNPYVDAKSD